MTVLPLRKCFAVLLMGLLIGLVGCGEKLADVSGEVLIKDKDGKEKPLDHGVIGFASQGGRKVVKSSVITKGKYSISGIPVGKALVSIQGHLGEMPQKDAKGNLPKGKIKYPTMVNPKYHDPSKSGLEYEVVTGDQTKNFTVEP